MDFWQREKIRIWEWLRGSKRPRRKRPVETMLAQRAAGISESDYPAPVKARGAEATASPPEGAKGKSMVATPGVRERGLVNPLPGPAPSRAAPAPPADQGKETALDLWPQEERTRDWDRNWQMGAPRRDAYMGALERYYRERPSHPEWAAFDRAPQTQPTAPPQLGDSTAWDLHGRPDTSPMPPRRNDMYHLSGRDLERLFPRSQLSPQEGRGGAITISPRWEASNVVRIPNRWGLCGVVYETKNGRTTARYRVLESIACNRTVAPYLIAALDELDRRGLLHLIRSIGSFVPRHMFWDPRRSISTHTYGIAFDINELDLPPLSRADVREWIEQGRPLPHQDPRLIAVLEKHGFEPGQDWDNPDAMHFEFSDPRVWGLQP